MEQTNNCSMEKCPFVNPNNCNLTSTICPYYTSKSSKPHFDSFLWVILFLILLFREKHQFTENEQNNLAMIIAGMENKK